MIDKKSFDDTLNYLDTLCVCDNKRSKHRYSMNYYTAQILYEQHIGYKTDVYFIYNNLHFNIFNVVILDAEIRFSCYGVGKEDKVKIYDVLILSEEERIIREIIE